jgi:hypothetical protein
MSEVSKPVKKDKRTARDYGELLKRVRPNRYGLADFLVRPPLMTFESQDRQEQILLLMRRHIVTNLPWVLGFGVMLLAPLSLSFFPILEFLPLRFQGLTIWFWYLFTLGWAWEKFLAWYFNVYIVTDERVIDLDFYSLIYKNVSATKISNIEDVTYTTSGAVQSLFNFGTLTIQTAAEKREFEFESIPNPDVVAGFLNEMILEEEKEELEGRVR